MARQFKPAVFALDAATSDLGALFVYLKPSDLKARRFKRAYAWIDGH